jgi:hypothetical protein
MVPTLSLRIGDFTLAGTLAARRSPIALSPGGSQDAVNGYGFAPGAVPPQLLEPPIQTAESYGRGFSPRSTAGCAPRRLAMMGAIIMEACACPLRFPHQSKLALYMVALPSRVPMTLTRRQRRAVYGLVFLERTRTAVAARSVIAILSLLSKAFNACRSTKKRSAHPHAR